MCCGMGCIYETRDGGCNRPAGSPCALDDEAMAEYEYWQDERTDRMVDEMLEERHANGGDQGQLAWRAL